MKTEDAQKSGPKMISLKHALLCVNCELICQTERDCPHCCSKQLMPLAQMIGGSLVVGATKTVSAMKNKSGSTIPGCDSDKLTSKTITAYRQVVANCEYATSANNRGDPVALRGGPASAVEEFSTRDRRYQETF